MGKAKFGKRTVCFVCALALCGSLTAGFAVLPAVAEEADGVASFDFKTMQQEELSSDFEAFYSQNNDDMAADPLSNWTLSSNGVTSKTYNESGGNPWENNSFLVYRGEESYRYAEITVKFTIGESNDNSYTGIAFGINNKEKSPKTSGNNGGHVYVTNWGHLYLEGWLFNENGGTVTTTPQQSAVWDSDKYKNDANDAGDAFAEPNHEYWGETGQLAAEHTLVVRLTDNTVDISLDPAGDHARTLRYAMTGKSGITFGDVALYSSNQGSTFSSFSVKPLNADGSALAAKDETGLRHYSFADFDETRFQAYHAPADNVDWATSERDFSEAWSIDEKERVLTKTSSRAEETTDLRDVESLVIKGLKFDYFEIETKIKLTTWSSFAGGKYAAVGFAFGWNNFTRSAAYGENRGGGIAYLNNDGHLDLKADAITSAAGANGTIGGLGQSHADKLKYEEANQVVRNTADDSINPWGGTENWNIVHTLKLRVTDHKMELILDEGLACARSVSFRFNDDVQDGIKSGAIGIFASNQSVKFFDGIDVRYLDGNGDPIAIKDVSSISLDTLSATQEVNTSLKVEPKIAPADATVKDFLLESSQPTVAKAVGDVLVFVGKGETKITVTSAFDSTKVAEKTITVGDRDVSHSLAIDLSDPARTKLAAYYQEAGQSDAVAVEEELSAHWTVADGVLTRTNDLGGDDVASHYAELWLNRTFTSFEISYMLRAGADPGWAGVMFGKTNYSTFFDQGDAAYLATHDGKATFWGQTIGAYSDAGNEKAADYYRQNEWNYVKLQVFGTDGGRTVRLYVNDMTTPVVERVQPTAAVPGKICLFTTTATADFKEIVINYLTETGTVKQYVATQSVTIGNKTATAKVGDTLTLQVVSAPAEGTNGGVSFESSDPAVASVTQSGVVTFLSAGSATITAVSDDDPDIRDSMTVTVTDPVITAISITNKVTTAKVGDQLVLTVTRTPANAVGDYVFETSDAKVATVSATGIVKFVGAGEVTITVKASDNAEIKDTMKVTVAAQGGSETKDPSEKKGGCGSLIGVFPAGLALLLTGGAIVLLINRRKDS